MSPRPVGPDPRSFDGVGRLQLFPPAFDPFFNGIGSELPIRKERVDSVDPGLGDHGGGW